MYLCGMINCLYDELEYCPDYCPILKEGQEAQEEHKKMLEQFEDKNSIDMYRGKE